MRQTVHEILEELKKNPLIAVLFLALGASAGFAVAKFSADEKVSAAQERASTAKAQVDYLQSQMENVKDANKQAGSDLARCQARPGIANEDELQRCQTRLTSTVARCDGTEKNYLASREQLAFAENKLKILEKSSATMSASCTESEAKLASMPSDVLACVAKTAELTRAVEQGKVVAKGSASELGKLRSIVKDQEGEVQRLRAEVGSINGKHLVASQDASACKASLADAKAKLSQISERPPATAAPSAGARAVFRRISFLSISANSSVQVLDGAVFFALDGGSPNQVTIRTNAVEEGIRKMRAGEQLIFRSSGKDYVLTIDGIGHSGQSVTAYFGERL